MFVAPFILAHYQQPPCCEDTCEVNKVCWVTPVIFMHFNGM